jgi:hypothetical protein
MEQVDPSWWGDEDEFETDLKARIAAGGKGASDGQRKDAREAQRLLLARNALRRQGRDPFAPQAPQPAPEPPEAPRAASQAHPVPFATRGPVMNLGVYGHPVAQSQANHLKGMIDDVTGAWGDELDSRVSQAREAARMEHEQQMEAMRNEAMLRRLQVEMEERERERRARNGGLLRRVNGGPWEVV